MKLDFVLSFRYQLLIKKSAEGAEVYLSLDLVKKIGVAAHNVIIISQSNAKFNIELSTLKCYNINTIVY